MILTTFNIIILQDPELQVIWESGVDYMFELAMAYLFCQYSFKLELVGESSSDDPYIRDVCLYMCYEIIVEPYLSLCIPL